MRELYGEGPPAQQLSPLVAGTAAAIINDIISQFVFCRVFWQGVQWRIVVVLFLKGIIGMRQRV